MSHKPSRRMVLQWLADCLFLPLAIAYAFSAAALGCSGSVSVNTGGNGDPDRMLGSYATPGWFAESASTGFFGYWLDGDSGISPAEGQAFQQAVGPLRSRATIRIVRDTIVYEETATEIATGRIITITIPGTWSNDTHWRLRVNWRAAVVTASTFPTVPPFAVAAVGRQVQRPQPGDLIQANSTWNQLTRVWPGPRDGVFIRGN